MPKFVKLTRLDGSAIYVAAIWVQAIRPPTPAAQRGTAAKAEVLLSGPPVVIIETPEEVVALLEGGE